MSAVQWNPRQYLHYQDQRLRPFLELLDRIDCPNPSDVVDLGCGPGNATMMLLELWPSAHVVGVDNSREMLDQAEPLAKTGKFEFQLGDISTWTAERPLDVIVSNAAFQWVPSHFARFESFVEMLKPNGWFAFQVPNMAQAASHQMLAELAESPRWRDQLASMTRSLAVKSTIEYVEALQGYGCNVDAWETTYMQVLDGEDAVLEWVRGSSMRPFLTALNAADATEFESTYRQRVAAVYPRTSHGTIYPFQRIFVVAQKLAS